MTRLHGALAERGAVPRFVGAALGQVQTSAGDAIDVEISLETGPSVLWDAVVLPDGEDAIKELSQLGQAMEFVKDQYRHCKPILALGAARQLLEAAGIWTKLPDGDADPGVLHLQGREIRKALEPFVAALVKHRHFERETDPPRV